MTPEPEQPADKPPARPRAIPRGERKPIKAFDERGQRLVDLMVFGLDDPQEAANAGLPLHDPLTLENAAPLAGLKLRNARYLFSQRVFLAEFSKTLASVRDGHRARAVATLVNLMNEPGDNTAADRTARLKAANSIMGDEGKSSGPAVSVNVGVSLSTVGVIRLPAGVAAPPLEHQAIEHEPAPRMRMTTDPATMQEIYTADDEGEDQAPDTVPDTLTQEQRMCDFDLPDDWGCMSSIEKRAYTLEISRIDQKMLRLLAELPPATEQNRASIMRRIGALAPIERQRLRQTVKANIKQPFTPTRMAPAQEPSALAG